jgi:hypothetical protein
VVPSFLRSGPVALSAPPRRPPAAPTAVAAYSFCIGWEQAGATVHWNAVNTPDVDGYVLYRVDRPDAWPVVVKRLDGRDAWRYVDRSLRPGDTPTYYVRAVGGRLASVPSRVARPRVPGFCLPPG